MLRKFSETINTLKAAATNRLKVATLSLSEQDGIGIPHANPRHGGRKVGKIATANLIGNRDETQMGNPLP